MALNQPMAHGEDSGEIIIPPPASFLVEIIVNINTLQRRSIKRSAFDAYVKSFLDLARWLNRVGKVVLGVRILNREVPDYGLTFYLRSASRGQLKKIRSEISCILILFPE